MYGTCSDRDGFMKYFRFETICNIAQDPQNLLRFNCACWIIDNQSAVIKYPLLFSTVISINGKWRFNQLATGSATVPYIRRNFQECGQNRYINC